MYSPSVLKSGIHTRMKSNPVANFMRTCGKGVVVITGAGCSTESGIPDYRSPNGLYNKRDFKPLTRSRFMSGEREQRRYWVRSLLGYSTMSHACCNATHLSLQALSEREWIRRIVTQNVDGLHHLAANGGSLPFHVEDDTTLYTRSIAPLTELHGNIHLVSCMNCKAVSPRRLLQRRLREANTHLLRRLAATELDGGGSRPDGDFDANETIVDDMVLVRCTECDGNLRPHVVLFGENVPVETVESTFAVVRKATGVLCLGTSLQVYSAFRFVDAASKNSIPIMIVNHGVTRGDSLATEKVDTSSVATVMREAAGDLMAM